MSRQTQCFLALLCYVILMALPFAEVPRLPLRYRHAFSTACSGGNMLVEHVCARAR